jgi:hypothetical protein
MPKLFRRSWERQKMGKQGAITLVRSAREGTNGAFSGTAASPSAQFTAAGANFTASDLNRLIRLVDTPNAQRFDGVYIIDSVVNSDTVVLRYNHNVPGTPTSLAVFREIASGVTWKILESCTFTVSGADDTIEDFQAGSNITIETGVAANRGTWLVAHRLSATQVILSKSYIWYIADHLAANTQKAFWIDHFGDFTEESGLRWYLHDRQTFTAPDQGEVILQALIDMGWTVFQVRGPSTTMNLSRDIILRSQGEDNTGISGGKAMFLRFVMYGTARTGTAPLHSFGNYYITMGVYMHWDPTQTAGGSPGNGIGGLRFNNSATDYAVPPGVGPGTAGGMWAMGTDVGDVQNGSGRGGLPASQVWLNWSVFGDRDEFWVFTNREGLNTGWTHAGLSHLKLVGGTNPNVVQVTAPFTSGTNKTLNVGTVDVQALTPPYQIGDNISIIGRKTTATAEYIFTSSITAFNNTDPNNRTVTISNADTAMGNGPDALKCQFGEDPFPVCAEGGTSTGFVARLHNLTRLAHATGRDHDTTNQGSISTDFNAIGNFGELNPSRRSGKWGLIAVYVKNTTSGEVRGRFRYHFRAQVNKFPLYKKLVFANNDVYVFASPLNTTEGIWVGPMSKTMAGVI